MQDLGTQSTGKATATTPGYSAFARRLHWWTVVFLLVQIPLGFSMAYRGNDLNIWDGLTNNLYSSHKLIGLVFLLLILTRLIYRLTKGAPADEPTLTAFERFASHATHWGLYALLLLVAIGGWIGVSYYDARDVFGLFSIPALTVKDTDFAARVFTWHKWGAIAIMALAGLHIAAALMHYFVKKDGVLARMLPAAGRRS